MKITLSIIITLVSISFAHAHSNHMSFENVQHDVEQTQDVNNQSSQIRHSVNEGTKHNDVPCVEQHKTTPCKKK